MKDNFGNSLNKTIATGIIASAATLGLITCAFANFATYLPLLIISLNTLAITSVWIFGRPRKPDSPTIKQLNNFETRIHELETRLQNAEQIDAFEDRLAKKHIESLDTPVIDKKRPTRNAPSSSMPTAQ